MHSHEPAVLGCHHLAPKIKSALLFKDRTIEVHQLTRRTDTMARRPSTTNSRV